MSDSESEEDSSSPEKRGTIIQTARIIDGNKCSSCEVDLEANGFLEKLRRRQVASPIQCPNCQTVFITMQVPKIQRPEKEGGAEPPWKCENCDTRLHTADPNREVFCSKCGCILEYPPELLG
jgi:DNA-directed RNA polymerase subunit RPC12/RpoP